MTRNIGINVSAPKREPQDGEKKNPFNGTLSVRGKLVEGRVVSASAKNTIVIERDVPTYYTKFKRYARSRNRIHAHVPSNIDVAVDNRVLVAECRPISKSVAFVVVEVKDNVSG